MIELRVLGAPQVLRDGEPVALQPKRLGLLAYLALADRAGIQRRDALLGVFWPDQDTAHARASLRQALRGIRQALGDGILVTRGDEDVGVDLNKLVVDARVFEHAKDDTAYDGPFLQGFHLGGCPQFDYWVESERERLATAFADVVEGAAQAATTNGDHREAAEQWRRLRLKAPYNARAVVGVMQALSAAGNRAAAIAQFERYRDQLSRDLELGPEPEVVAVAEQLKNGASKSVASEHRMVSGELEVPRDRARWWLRPLYAAGLAVAAVALALAVAGMVSRTPLRPNHVAVLPARVIAPESDAYLETGLPNLLAIALDGAGEISTVDMNRLLPSSERAGGGVPSVEEAMRLSRDLEASLFLLSNVMRVDTTLHITVRLYEVEGGEEPVVEAFTVGPEREIWDLVHSLALDIVTQLPAGEGHRLSDLSAVRPANYSALKAYLQGEHAFRVRGALAAIEAFDRAIAEDSTFGLAWYRLSAAQGWWDHAEARESVRRARDLSNELSERDSLFVEARYAMWWGDPDRADRLTRQNTQLYPDHVEAWHARGKYLQFFGWRHGIHPNESEAAFRKTLELDGRHPSALWGLGVVLNKLRRPTEGYVYLDRWRATNPTWWGGPGGIIKATLKPDPAGDSLLQRLSDIPHADIEVAMRITASAQSFSGSVRLARSLIESHRPSEYQAIGHLHLAHLSAARGRWLEAVEHFGEVSKMFPARASVYQTMLLASPFLDRPEDELKAARDSLLGWSATFDDGFYWGIEIPPILRQHMRVYLLGILEGRLGNDVASDAYADTLFQAAESADSLNLLYDLSIELRALGQLARTDTAAALATLEGSRLTVGFDHWVSPFHKRWYGTFLRAELLYAEARDDEAVGWYSSFGPGNESVDYVYFPWSHFRRGQSFERIGQPDSAIAHYDVFVDEWTNADPQYLTLVADVRDRLSALKSEQGL